MTRIHATIISEEKDFLTILKKIEEKTLRL